LRGRNPLLTTLRRKPPRTLLNRVCVLFHSEMAGECWNERRAAEMVQPKDVGIEHTNRSNFVQSVS